MSTRKKRGQHARFNKRDLQVGSRGRSVRSPIWWWAAPLVLAPFLPGFRPDTSDADASSLVLEDSIRTVGTELPLHVNARVEKWLDRFQTSGRAEFAKILSRTGIYDDLIRGKLRERGMPEELVYLAMMESGLSPWAVSQVSAVGMWQFMSPTAIEYGLRVDQYVDERKDPVRATDAALDYLEWLHGRFGSWYLAAAAYNAGPSRVHAILGRHAEGRTGDEDLYWKVLDHLPAETREYVPRLVAATILAEGATEYGFQASLAEPYSFDQVFVPGGTELARVAQAIDLSQSVLRDLNPHLTRGVTPPGEIYGVRVPIGASPRVVAALGGQARWFGAADE